MWRLLLFIFCGLSPLATFAQSSPDGARDSDGSRDVDSTSFMPDTVKLRYFKIDRLGSYYEYKDSSLSSSQHNYDPARKPIVDYIHLGNQGSAAANLRYELEPTIGFREGHTQYDLYNLELSDFKFYEANIPLVNVAFSPMGSQDHFVINADFTRTFSDGFSLSANYQRVNQQGIYSNQATKITNFGVSLKYDHPAKRYTAFLSMISNANQEDNNGGPLSPIDSETAGRGDREVITTSISGATTRHQQKYYSLVNYYKLNSKNSALDLLFRYDIGADFRYYKYSDPDTDNVNDQLFYGDDLNVDFRGLRNYTRVTRINNAAYLYLSGKKNLNIRAGIVYDRYSIEQDIISSSYDNVYLDFSGTIPFINQLSLETKGQIGIGDGVGDFILDGALDVNIGSIGSLEAGVSFYRQSSSLLEQSYYLSQDTIWNNNEFTKPFGSQLYARLHIPKLHLRAEVSQQILNNPIYFNQDARPVQDVPLFTATTLTVSNDINWKIFHLENTAMVQLMNQNIYGLPTLWTKHNFFMEFYMFKRNLKSRWGVETRLSPTYNGLGYSPAIGVFHLSGAETVFYPTTDVYFSGKVKKFRIFIKLENLNQVIDATKIDYRIANYPQQDWRIRLGVAWLFLG